MGRNTKETTGASIAAKDTIYKSTIGRAVVATGLACALLSANTGSAEAADKPRVRFTTPSDAACTGSETCFVPTYGNDTKMLAKFGRSYNSRREVLTSVCLNLTFGSDGFDNGEHLEITGFGGAENPTPDTQNSRMMCIEDPTGVELSNFQDGKELMHFFMRRGSVELTAIDLSFTTACRTA